MNVRLSYRSMKFSPWNILNRFPVSSRPFDLWSCREDTWLSPDEFETPAHAQRQAHKTQGQPTLYPTLGAFLLNQLTSNH